MCEAGYISECQYRKLRVLQTHTGIVQGAAIGNVRRDSPTLNSLNHELKNLKAESSVIKEMIKYLDERIMEVEMKLEKYQNMFFENPHD